MAEEKWEDVSLGLGEEDKIENKQNRKEGWGRKEWGAPFESLTYPVSGGKTKKIRSGPQGGRSGWGDAVQSSGPKYTRTVEN